MHKATHTARCEIHTLLARDHMIRVSILLASLTFESPCGNSCLPVDVQIGMQCSFCGPAFERSARPWAQLP
jgi:hypothetical protein